MGEREARIVYRDLDCIIRDAEYIIDKAREQDARIVSHTELFFFSTGSGDAWLLDIDDELATCLALGGIKQDYSITKASDRFRIEWDGTYKMRGDTFVVTAWDGTTLSITGYPLDQIDEHIRLIRG